jgi:hypothetical protein
VRIGFSVSGLNIPLGGVRQKDMSQLYRNNDIFVMSSWHDSMSKAILKAMA